MDHFGIFVVGQLDLAWADETIGEVETNTMAYVLHRDREMVSIEDDLGSFPPREVPFAAFRDYLLARYP